MAVRLDINHHPVDAAPGETVFACAEKVGVRVPTSCRKQGRCKECVVEVVEGMERLSERAHEERHLKGAFRLACSARVVAEEGVVRCHTMRRGEMKIETRGVGLPAGGRSVALDPAVTRASDRVLLDGHEIARHAGPVHGLAIDLGTTTIVMRLFDLETGAAVAESSFENPQRFGGSDVMSRIHFDGSDGSHTLQRTLAGYLSREIAALPVDPQSIFEVVIAGNSTMRDLFFRLSVQSIGQSPYRSLTELEVDAGLRKNTSLVDSGRRLGLPVHPLGRVYGLPIMSGHVGADAAACMLAIDLANEERLVAVMDIGTNTELIVGNKRRVLVASCPAGPAFEGGDISCGMPGLPGAIEKVSAREDGAFDVAVIGGGAPEGICGSGLVDLLAELLRTERMNALGRFEHGPEPIVVAGEGAEAVTFTEADVNALAQAKGANIAGISIALSDYGVRASEVEVFYLAGGFGRHLSVESAQRIGLIPTLPAERVRQVGNAALEGACLALLSRSKREELEQLVRRATHCRLEAHPRFFDHFVEGCQFGAVEAGEALTES